MGNKVKSSTKKFVKNKLAGAIKKRREKQHHASARAVIPKQAAAPKQPAALTTKEPDVGVDERDEGGFEDYLEKELQDFEVDEEEEDEEEKIDVDVDEDDEDDEDGDDLQEQHNAELQQLRETDPEFFAFLQKNDPSLLQFGEEQEGGDDEDEDEEEAEERPAWVGRSGKKAVAKAKKEKCVVVCVVELTRALSRAVASLSWRVGV